jgi:hypothetical protein
MQTNGILIPVGNNVLLLLLIYRGLIERKFKTLSIGRHTAIRRLKYSAVGKIEAKWAIEMYTVIKG